MNETPHAHAMVRHSKAGARHCLCRLLASGDATLLRSASMPDLCLDTCLNDAWVAALYRKRFVAGGWSLKSRLADPSLLDSTTVSIVVRAGRDSLTTNVLCGVPSHSLHCDPSIISPPLFVLS
jgi:hypothetical protein